MANSKNITFDQLYSSLLAVKEYAAEKEHGTHVIYATTSTDIVPGEQGVAGSANNCAKGDHTHSIPPYPTELKSPGTLSIRLLEPSKALPESPIIIVTASNNLVAVTALPVMFTCSG